MKIEGPLPVLVLFPAAALKELKVKGSLLIAAGEGSLLRILDRPSDFALLKRILQNTYKYVCRPKFQNTYYVIQWSRQHLHLISLQ